MNKYNEFYELLSKTIVTNGSDTFINVECYYYDCEDFASSITCQTVDIPLSSIFGNTCDIPSLKLRCCVFYLTDDEGLIITDDGGNKINFN